MVSSESGCAYLPDFESLRLNDYTHTVICTMTSNVLRSYREHSNVHKNGALDSAIQDMGCMLLMHMHNCQETHNRGDCEHQDKHRQQHNGGGSEQ